MAILQMQRVSICALKRDRKAILEMLQSMGVMEINPVQNEEEVLGRMDTAHIKNRFEQAATSADRALKVLDEYVPVKGSLLVGLRGKEQVANRQFQEVVSEQETLLKVVNQIHALHKEKAEYRAEISKLENRIESLIPWINLDIGMETSETKDTAIFLGSLPRRVEVQDLYQMLAKEGPDIEAVDIEVVSSSEAMTCIAVLCLKKESGRVEEVLRNGGFTRNSIHFAKTPIQERDKLQKEIEEKKSSIDEVDRTMETLSGYRSRLCLLADYYRVRAEKYEVLGELPQSERTFLISGYVPKKEVETLRKTMECRYDCIIDIEELNDEEDPPVLLKNNAFSKNAEGVLAAFGLPNKGEIDPTGIMCIFYVVLFGLMLSDAAYGAIISIVCGVLIRKFPRMESSMKRSIQLFFWCGLSTLFWGVMFGGYFGDVVNVVSKTFFGREVGIPAVWFVPLEEPMRLLIYAMGFGVIHLFTGLGIKGYLCIRDRRYTDFFCDVVTWFVLLIGLLIMLLPSNIFASIAQTTIVFPAGVSLVGKWMAILGAIGIIFLSGRANKKFGLRIALGAYDLYNITSWLSDVLSYSRLLALGLATGVIAQVVNQMGTMAGNGVIGVVLFIIVFVVGHTFNITINLLGAYVHTNRLQYIEFFGKFYEGGGRAFRPFKEHTKYADIKEEL